MQAAGFALDNKAIYKQAPSFFYESGGPSKKSIDVGVQRISKQLQALPGILSTEWVGSRPQSKEFPQLQAADYLAFNVSKRASHVVDPNPPSDAILETLANGKKVRKMRYPLSALYGKEGGNIFHAPTVDILEKMLHVLESDADQADSA